MHLKTLQLMLQAVRTTTAESTRIFEIGRVNQDLPEGGLVTLLNSGLSDTSLYCGCLLVSNTLSRQCHVYRLKGR